MKTILLLFLFFCSCKSVYVPNGRNSPLFQGAGELQASVSITNGYDIGKTFNQFGKATDGLGFDFQMALSVSDHFGLMSNYSFVEKAYDQKHHWIGEAGLGFFNNSNNMCFEIFAGVGKGEGSSRVNDQYSSHMGPVNSQYVRYFVQPAFGFNKKFHLSFVNRISIVDFSSFIKENRSPTIFFFEPAILGKVKIIKEHLFFNWQFGLSLAGQGYPSVYLDHSPVYMSMGLTGKIGLFKE